MLNASLDSVSVFGVKVSQSANVLPPQFTPVCFSVAKVLGFYVNEGCLIFRVRSFSFVQKVS